MRTVNIYEYGDFRKYLSDWQNALQSDDHSLNKSEISRLLGLPRTRSYFTDVLAGKKVTPTFVDRFVAVLDLPKDEARFFRALVAFNQAISIEERETSFDLLISASRSPSQKLSKDQQAYYKHWWVGAIRAILAIQDHFDDWSRLARAIQPAITPSQAKQAIATLSALGLIEDKGGHWKPTVQALTTGDGSRDKNVLSIQSQHFHLASLSAMMPTDQGKDLTTNTISVSEAGFESILRRIRAFRAEIRSIVKRDELPPDRVYQLCLALFPLSRNTQ